MDTFTSEAERDAFLAAPRLAILITNRTSGVPMGVPVWFAWDGQNVEIFAAKDSIKIKRLERDSKISVLVTNDVGEREAWVAFDGNCEILEHGAGALITQVAPKYWDMKNPELRATIDDWVAAEDNFVRIRLTPEVVRSGQ